MKLFNSQSSASDKPRRDGKGRGGRALVGVGEGRTPTLGTRQKEAKKPKNWKALQENGTRSKHVEVLCLP